MPTIVKKQNDLKPDNAYDGLLVLQHNRKRRILQSLLGYLHSPMQTVRCDTLDRSALSQAKARLHALTAK